MKTWLLTRFFEVTERQDRRTVRPARSMAKSIVSGYKEYVISSVEVGEIKSILIG